MTPTTATYNYISFPDGSIVSLTGPASLNEESAKQALTAALKALGGSAERSKPTTLELLDRSLSVDEICKLRKAGLA